MRVSKSLIVGTSAMALFAAAPLFATTPQAPIALEDAAQPWLLTLRLDTQHFSDFYLKQSVLAHGQPIASQTEPLAVDSNASGDAVISVPVATDLQGQRDGLYCQVVEAGGRRIGREQGYVSRQFVYFEVKTGTPRRISLREYSNRVDPVVFLPGPDGSREPLQLGALRTDDSAPGADVGTDLQLESGHDPQNPQSSDERNER